MNDMTTTPPDSFEALTQQDDFVGRHIGPRPADIERMLAAVGAGSLDDLIDQTVPAAIRDADALPLPGPVSEAVALARLRELAGANRVLRSLIGMGYHDTITPPVIQRNVLENPGWYTAYTPYQPEISQGRLEALLVFQQLIIDLTGMDLANASLLDEGTAAAEGMALCKRMARRNKSSLFFVDRDCHPQTISVVRTRAANLGLDVQVGDPQTELADADVFGALFQYPGTTGAVRDLSADIDALHARDALAVVAADPLSLLLLKTPGAMGADVAVGNTQRFGVPLGYGGPHAAFFATRDAFKRSIPGRIIGVSIDSNGNRAYRMAMQTREQHIRREKATSNICTAQALLAIMAAFYAVYHGPEGLTTIATRVHRLATLLAARLRAAGYRLCHDRFFDTLCVDLGSERDARLAAAEAAGFNLRPVGEGCVGIALDERSDLDELAALLRVFDVEADTAALLATEPDEAIPPSLRRDAPCLEHPVFHDNRSETDMLRFMRRLESKDIALNRAMIPLGSCTMKLNATAEMLPVTWPEFGAMHPFAPNSQAAGYTRLLDELERMLTACTGYDRISFQPNSGAQGEYAGLLAIKRYHESRGESHRDVCLIPSSAHGTNPASAAMAGMRVVIVECDEHGNVDFEDLSTKAERHGDELAALMVTYPSTHGVFEERIRDICALIHEHGGQVYVDGANMNALVGVAGPGQFGADVSHLNLHKTFCIPHGGGGPGMGPIGVREHLAPFLPGDPLDLDDREHDVVSSTPFGSASILPISWMYMTMMGGSGLTRATQVAILSANYIARRIGDHFKILYTGRNQRVAHECIIDLRPLKDRCGVTEEDVAKRLIDYGFHAPTMSFPVPGTLMVEPTESEPLAELDRFCDAMLAIHAEITEIENGSLDAQNNPLKHAPHTAAVLLDEAWSRPYTRERAAYPVPETRQDKYWPPVGRIDNVYGDRHLVCSCPSIDSYRED
jgi:glycine dehydrogenase